MVMKGKLQVTELDEPRGDIVTRNSFKRCQKLNMLRFTNQTITIHLGFKCALAQDP